MPIPFCFVLSSAPKGKLQRPKQGRPCKKYRKANVASIWLPIESLGKLLTSPVFSAAAAAATAAPGLRTLRMQWAFRNGTTETCKETYIFESPGK